MSVPRWLHWLASPDPRPERGTPDPLAKVTEEEIDAEVDRFLASFERAERRTATADTHRFVHSLTRRNERPTTWPSKEMR